MASQGLPKTIRQWTYPMPVPLDLIPVSDAAGTVVSVGKRVTRFKAGDKVVTLFMQEHLNGPNGASLPCAALTAWDSLYGIAEKAIKPGYIFALRFAKAAGARVIATTGSPQKVPLLEKLGADHILNYRETSDWGIKAKELSLASIKRFGVISIVGFLSGLSGSGPTHLENLLHLCTTRDMMQAISGNLEKLRPVIDERVFKFEETDKAFEYLDSGKHQGKVVIEVS
ncbi:alcohol dehydrogenase [Dactylonectria estremocensis]|uniref:Alcohol dehydrogenase n=1 Tax=Dactylonectria estremocensis TaxID=1079267 RepID=A0A9P9EUP5_9HYPO|nr:alcohol dehydrogenase [Dactylonectria estremocensis]